ncbi:hypothetical protein BH24ACT26_BH24ACT26_07850 [soil metagenome]
MSDRLAARAVCAAVAGGVAGGLVPVCIRLAPVRLARVNVRGASVPAVLGGPLVAGALAGTWALALVGDDALLEPSRREVAAATSAVLLVTGIGGLVDDLRGDEASRGFGGHLAALRSGHVTGGVVKMAAGAVGGLWAGTLLPRGAPRAEAAVLVALAANLANLLDRAPGRATKTALLAGSPLLVLGAPVWRPSGWGLLGALLACLPPDLAEKAMLGDAGANPIGAVLGVGLALSLKRRSRLAAIGALAAANAASERWSFSRGIERVRWLRSLDHLGRTRGPSPRPGPNPPPPC